MPELWAKSADGVNRKLRELWEKDNSGINRKQKELWAKDGSGVNRKIFSGYDCQAHNLNNLPDFGEIYADGKISCGNHTINGASEESCFKLIFDHPIYFTQDQLFAAIENMYVYCENPTGITFYLADENNLGIGSSFCNLKSVSETFELTFNAIRSGSSSAFYFEVLPPNNMNFTFGAPAGCMTIGGQRLSSIELI